MTNGGSLLKDIDEMLDKDEIDQGAALKLLLSFVRNYLCDDHEKIKKMWPIYKLSIAAYALIGAEIVALFFLILTHRITFP